MSEAELEAAIASDADGKDVPRDWHRDAVAVATGAKRLISLRLDPGVLDFFKGEGPRCQTRSNAVLRAYMRARRQAGG
ncbi:MAG: BrnA antitoxin family protein [Acetobacteraceae bacterium]|nr:BrnA antitoxin family protein [Acetobacteraceae bacterium]